MGNQFKIYRPGVQQLETREQKTLRTNTDVGVLEKIAISPHHTRRIVWFFAHQYHLNWDGSPISTNWRIAGKLRFLFQHREVGSIPFENIGIGYTPGATSEVAVQASQTSFSGNQPILEAHNNGAKAVAQAYEFNVTADNVELQVTSVKLDSYNAGRWISGIVIASQNNSLG